MFQDPVGFFEFLGTLNNLVRCLKFETHVPSTLLKLGKMFTDQVASSVFHNFCVYA